MIVEYTFDNRIVIRYARRKLINIFDMRRKKGTTNEPCRRNPRSFMNTLLSLAQIGTVSYSYDTKSVRVFPYRDASLPTYKDQRLVDIAQIIPEAYVDFLDSAQDLNGLSANKLKLFFKKKFTRPFARSNGTGVAVLREDLLRECLSKLEVKATTCSSYVLNRPYGQVEENYQRMRLPVEDKKVIARCLVLLCRTLHRRVVDEYEKSWQRYHEKTLGDAVDTDRANEVDPVRLEKIKNLVGYN